MLKLCSAPDTMIHSSVGIDSTSRYGLPSRRRSPIACVSTVPRFGSRILSAANAQRTPGIAATKNARRQPQFCRIHPPAPLASPRPSGSPSIHTAIARPREEVGNRSPRSEVDAGEHVASPTPTPRRATINCENDRAMPDAAVSRLQTNTPPARMRLRVDRSDSRPSGSPTTAYSSVNTVPSRPSAVSLSAHSRLMPSPTPPRIWRSKKFIRLIAKRTINA